jgi:acetyl esterase
MQNKPIKNTLLAIMSGAVITAGLYSCNSGNSSENRTDSMANADSAAGKTTDIKPAGEKPQWAPDIKPEMQAVIEKLASYNAPPIETLSAEEARKQPTPTTAVMDLMKEHNIPMPPAKSDTVGQSIPVKGGSIHARIYTPKEGNGPFPVIVYYHGGGWVIADLDTYNASAQGLCEQAKAVVISVHYRQAPEHKFPAAHEDAFAAYEWVVANAASLKGDAKKIAVVGESAGGNLAANVSIMARDKGIQAPVYQVLVYPVASNNMNSESYQKYAAAKPLNKPMMGWFAGKYLPSMQTAADPRIALVNANLKGLPPTTIITAEIDPLHDDGAALSEKLKSAGVEVDYKDYSGVTHEFFGMATVVPQAKDAQAYAADKLKGAFK